MNNLKHWFQIFPESDHGRQRRLGRLRIPLMVEIVGEMPTLQPIRVPKWITVLRHGFYQFTPEELKSEHVAQNPENVVYILARQPNNGILCLNHNDR